MAKGKGPSRREQFWREHVRQHQESGLTVREYCQLHQLGEASLYAWRRTFAQREQEATATLPAFVPVVVTEVPVTTEAPLELCWPDGRCLRIRVGCQRLLLAEVLAVLGEHGC